MFYSWHTSPTALDQNAYRFLARSHSSICSSSLDQANKYWYKSKQNCIVYNILILLVSFMKCRKQLSTALVFMFVAQGRRSFNSKAFASEHGLELVAGNLFNAERDELVPTLHKQLRFKPLPSKWETIQEKKIFCQNNIMGKRQMDFIFAFWKPFSTYRRYIMHY